MRMKLEFFQNQMKRALGAAWEGNTIYLTEAACMEGELTVCHVAQVSVPESLDWEVALEHIKVYCAKEGILKEPLGLAMRPETIYLYEKELPEMTETELSTTVRWEMEEGQPFGETGAVYAFQRLPGEKRLFLLAAMEKNLQEKLVRLAQENSLCLKSLSAARESTETFYTKEDGWYWGSYFFAADESLSVEEWSGGQIRALSAAISLLQPAETVNFLQTELGSHWNWLRISLSIMLCVLLFWSGVFAYGAWRLYSLDKIIQQQDHQLADLSSDRKHMQAVERILQKIDEKNQRLVELSQKAVPCYSILAHLGMHTVEGVSLEGVSTEDGEWLQLKGQAVSYDALASFLQELEKDIEFFPDGPILHSSEQSQEGALIFVIRLKF